MKYAIIIPNYNHEDVIDDLINDLARFNLPVIMVDDGSDKSYQTIFQQLSLKYSYLTVLSHDTNKGKGAAMQTGLCFAEQQGFSHALQIDADGQHDLADIELFLAHSKQFPHALLSGRPIFDDSVPKHRFYARYITHVWVWIETLSFTLQDSMCGFRVYPLAVTVKLLQEVNIGKRMDFDTEIMVRLFWRKIEVDFIATKVHYPEQGISHFRPFADNVLISWMHTRLFFGMLLRLPILLSRKVRSVKRVSR